MNIQDAKTIHIGTKPVTAIYLGTNKIWPKLPYTPLEHITFNGSQYIDTGIDTTGTPSVFCDFMYPAAVTMGNFLLFGNAGAAGVGVYVGFTGPTSGYRFYNGTLSTGSSGAVIGVRSTATVSGRTCTLTYAGKTETIAAGPTPSTSSKTIWLGNSNGKPAGAFTGNMYGFQIAKNDVLVADMIPARLNTTSQIGLWDNTRQQFYPPTQGTLTGA